MGDDGPWFSLHYTLDEHCWGYLLEHAEEGVYSYALGERRVVPSFRRFEHAALFARQLVGRPELARGGSYDLSAVHAYATHATETAPETLEDVWWFLLDVAGAAEEDAGLTDPPDAAEPRQALQACFAALHRSLLHLDG